MRYAWPMSDKIDSEPAAQSPAVMESPRMVTTGAAGAAALATLTHRLAKTMGRPAMTRRREGMDRDGCNGFAYVEVRGRSFKAPPPRRVRMTEPALLQLEHVALTLPSTAGPVEILRDVSLSVWPGEKVAVLGPSGSGKSSLISVAAGLERPTAGSVHLFGEDLGPMDEDGRARLRRGRAALVFQAFHLLPNMTAEENVAAPGHYPHQLSGGEQQRVALARALAPNPAILIADEPTGNLDDATAQDVSALMFDLLAETGAALVLVTHDPSLARRADRRLQMQGGRLSE